MNTRSPYGFLPLHWAALGDDAPAIKKLVESGMGINERSKNGASPLHVAAALNENLAITKALLEAGADVHARDKWGGTPLHLAAALNENPDVVEALLDAGADHRAKTKGEVTALNLIEKNEALEDTQVRWRLNDLSYK